MPLDLITSQTLCDEVGVMVCVLADHAIAADAAGCFPNGLASSGQEEEQVEQVPQRLSDGK